MSWDASLPTDSTKIRNYPTVLQDNFGAIEQGDASLLHWQANFIDRQQVPGAPPPAADPTRIADTMILYAKQHPTSGETEFFVMDDQASPNLFALTDGGFLGARGTRGKFQNITIGSNSFVNNQNSFVFAHGLVPAAGGAITGSGLGSATIGTVGSDSNAYTIPFSGRNPTNANYVVMITPESSRAAGQNNVRIGNVIPGTKTTSQFSVRIQANDANTNVTGVAFSVMIVGGF